MEIKGYKIHPLAEKVPEMTVNEYRQLKESLQATGQTAAIITYKGEIADGRHRLKACLELGYEPWIKEYDGDRPIAQFILSTNIRRNLTKVQRHQMFADFASKIIPEIDEKMKERQKSKPGRTNLVLKDSSERNSQTITPGRQALMDATGATAAEAQALKSIHDNARELLGEVAQRGGLALTEKEARRRAEEKEQKAKKKETETLRQRKIRFMNELLKKPLGLSREQVDPDFKGSPTDFIDKYGHVQLRTKTERELDRDKDNFSAWIVAIRALASPLREYVKVEQFQPENFHAWIKKAKDSDKRMAEVRELTSLIVQTRESIDWLLPLLEIKPINGDHP